MSKAPDETVDNTLLFRQFEEYIREGRGRTGGSGGGGASSSDGIEIRVVKLEADVGEIKRILGALCPKIDSIHTDTTTIKTEMKHTIKTLPGFFGMLTIFAMGYVVPQLPPLLSKDSVQEVRIDELIKTQETSEVLPLVPKEIPVNEQVQTNP